MAAALAAAKRLRPDRARRGGQFLGGNVSFRVRRTVPRRTAIRELVSRVWTWARTPNRRLQMAASTSEALARRRATYQDVLDAPPHRVAEIVDGTLHTHSRPAMPHARASSMLGIELGGPFDRGRGGPGGWWIVFEPELHLGEDILVPDVAGWRRERMPEYPATAYATLAPDWVCEVLSASMRRLDLQGKRPVYAPRTGPAPVARRPGGPHPGGVRAPRRGVGADRGGKGRRSDQHPAVRCDQLQPGGPLAVTRTFVVALAGEPEGRLVKATTPASGPAWPAAQVCAFSHGPDCGASTRARHLCAARR